MIAPVENFKRRVLYRVKFACQSMFYRNNFETAFCSFHHMLTVDYFLMILAMKCGASLCVMDVVNLFC